MKGLILMYIIVLTIVLCFVPKSKRAIKTEYKIELINQDSIKIYSVSNDTVYKCLYTDMEKVIELDNL